MKNDLTTKSRHTQEVAMVTALVNETGLNRTQVRRGLRDAIVKRGQELRAPQGPVAPLVTTPTLPQVSKSEIPLPARQSQAGEVPGTAVPVEGGGATGVLVTVTGNLNGLGGASCRVYAEDEPELL